MYRRVAKRYGDSLGKLVDVTMKSLPSTSEAEALEWQTALTYTFAGSLAVHRLDIPFHIQ